VFQNAQDIKRREKERRGGARENAKRKKREKQEKFGKNFCDRKRKLKGKFYPFRNAEATAGLLRKEKKI